MEQYERIEEKKEKKEVFTPSQFWAEKPIYKMYVWEDVLTDYTSGVVVVMAKSVEEARKIAHDYQDSDDLRDLSTVKSYSFDCDCAICVDLRKEPTHIYENQDAVVVCWGGG
jgi:hypothetical protein